MKKTGKKAISLFLTLCMALSLLAPMATATETEQPREDGILEIKPVAPVEGDSFDVPTETPEAEPVLDDYGIELFAVSEEIPYGQMTATAGSIEPTAGGASEGPANLVLDNNNNTHWHTAYTSPGIEHFWITLDLGGTYMVDGYKYVPRPAGPKNGTITGYQILLSTDGSTFKQVAEGTWAADSVVKLVEFDPTMATHVKLKATATRGQTSTENNQFASAAELRVTGVPADYEATFDNADSRGGWSKQAGPGSIAFTNGVGDAGYATLSVGGNNTEFVAANALTLQDGFVEADITPIGTHQQFALAFRYTDATHYTAIGYDDMVKWNWCGNGGTPWGDTAQKLADGPVPVDGTKLHLRIEYRGTNIRVLVDTHEIFSGILPSGSGDNSTDNLPTVAGKIGFRVWGSENMNSIRIDNVRMGALPTLYGVTVVNGTANPTEAAKGETVTITAAESPSEGAEFLNWSSSDGVVFDNANGAITTFTMPAKAVTVTANYAYPADTAFYIDSASGNDDASGTTKDTPWRSLAKVNSLILAPGSKIYLKASSTFEGQSLSLRGNGTAEEPIIVDMYNGDTIGAEAGAKPIIKANGIAKAPFTMGNEGNTATSHYPAISYGVHIQNMSHITVNNLEVTNQVAAAQTVDKEIGRFQVGVVVEAQSGNGVTRGIHLKDLYVHDVNGDKQQKTAPNGGIYFITTAPNGDETHATRYDDISIIDCRVENVSRTGISVGSSHSAHSWEGHSGGIIPQPVQDSFGHDGVVIRNNFLKNVGGDAIVPQFCISPLIEYNISDSASQNSGSDVGQYNAGIWPWRCEDAIFQFNEAFKTKDNGDGQAYDCDFSRGTVYQYNYSHDNGGGFMLMCMSQSIESIVRYNISQNDLVEIFLISNNGNDKIYNNTIYLRSGLNTQMVNGGGRGQMNNNIFYNAGQARSVNWGNFTYDTNLYYGFSNTPNDARKITADPMFVDPGNGGNGVLGNSANDTLGGYALRPGSPAIGAGVVIPNNGGRDYAGNLVSATAKPSIGALEYTLTGCYITSSAYAINQATQVISLTDGAIPVADFKGNLAAGPEGAAITVKKGGAEYNTGNVDAGVTVEVSKAGETTVTYAVAFAYPAPTLTSSVYTIDNTAGTISMEVAAGYDAFVANLTKPSNLVTFVVKHGDTAITTGGTVVENDTVVVTSGEQEKIYTVKYVVVPDSYNYETDLKAGIQGPYWYSEYTEGGVKKLFTDWRDWDAWAAMGDRLGVGRDKLNNVSKGLISTVSGHETMMTWVAPKSGKVELGLSYFAFPRRTDSRFETDKTVGFRVTKNGANISGDMFTYKQSELAMRPLVVNVVKGDRIAFTAFATTNMPNDSSTFFDPIVNYVTDKTPLVETNLAKAATKTASSTATGYAVAGLTDDSISANYKNREWKSNTTTAQWVNFAFDKEYCVGRIMLVSGKNAPIAGDITCSFSDGTTKTIPNASLSSDKGYVIIDLGGIQRTNYVKLAFADGAAITLGDVQILADPARTDLLALYNQHKGKLEADYAAAEWAAFAAARTTADTVLSRADATAQEITSAKTALTSSAAALKAVSAVTVTGGTTTTPKAAQGDTVSITAADPVEGKIFDKWTTTSAGVTFAAATNPTTTFTMPNNAVTVTATYKDMEYTVTVTGGNPAILTAHLGESVSITAADPVEGMIFDKWTTNDGVTFANAASAITTFTMPAKAVTVTANYKNRPADAHKVTVVGGGTATPSDAVQGAIVTLTAGTPGAGKEFAGWTSTDVTITNPNSTTEATFTMLNKDVTVTATYREIDYTVTVTGGRADKAKAHLGESVTITADVPDGQRFVRWTTNDGVTFANAASAITTFTMPAKNVTVTATFETGPQFYTITAVSGTATPGTALKGTTVTIKADKAPQGQEFVRWTTEIAGVTFANATNAQTTFTMPERNVTVTATYRVLTYAVTVTGGTADKEKYAAGDTVTITANPPAGKALDRWTITDGVTPVDATASPTTFIMPAKPVAVTASFKDAPTPPTPPSTGGSGTPTVKPEAPQTEGDVTTVTTVVKSTVKNGTARAEVTESTINAAIASAVKAAKESNTTAKVEVKIQSTEATSRVELSVSANGLSAIAKSAAAELVVSSSLGEITLDSKALTAVAAESKGAVSFAISQVDEKTIPAAEQTKIGAAPAFDLTISSGSKTISDFKGGSASVVLPYALRPGEDARFVSVWHLADDGKLSPVERTYADGKVSFTVGHFSRYAVGYLPFTDVLPSWYYEGVVYAYNSGAFKGVSANTFDPMGASTRGTLMAVLHRMSGAETGEKGDIWYAPAMAWATKLGISDGREPERAVTRVELAALLYRYYYAVAGDARDLAPAGNVGEEIIFTDAKDIPLWAEDAVAWCVKHGLISGKPGGCFDPNGTASRAEIASVLQRMAELDK